MRVRLLREGDVLIVQPTKPITREHADAIKARLLAVGIESVVIGGEIKLAVRRRRWGRKPR